MAHPSSNGATLGFEQTLWAAAEKLRGHLDAADYKHTVLGLIFLKYISDAFEEKTVPGAQPPGKDAKPAEAGLAEAKGR